MAVAINFYCLNFFFSFTNAVPHTSKLVRTVYMICELFSLMYGGIPRPTNPLWNILPPPALPVLHLITSQRQTLFPLNTFIYITATVKGIVWNVSGIKYPYLAFLATPRYLSEVETRFRKAKNRLESAFFFREICLRISDFVK